MKKKDRSLFPFKSAWLIQGKIINMIIKFFIGTILGDHCFLTIIRTARRMPSVFAYMAVG